MMPRVLNKKTQCPWTGMGRTSAKIFWKTGTIGFRVNEDWVFGKTSHHQYPHSTQKSSKMWTDLLNRACIFLRESSLDIDERIGTVLLEEDVEEPDVDYKALLEHWTELVDSARSLPRESLYQKLRDSFGAKLQETLTTESALDRKALQEFEQYARRIIAAKGIELTTVDIREWVSMEDQTWKQLIIEFKVEAKPEIALSLWDNLSAELRTFLNARWRKQSVQLRELLSVSVQW